MRSGVTINTRFLTGLILWSTVWLALLLCAPDGTAIGQNPESASNSNPSTATTTPSPTPIGSSSIFAQGEVAAARLNDIQAFLRDRPKNAQIATAIPEVVQQIDALESETRMILASRPTLDDLNNLEREWQGPTTTIAGWKNGLGAQAVELDKRIADLRTMKALWQRSLDALTASPAANTNTNPAESISENVPEEFLQRVRDIIASISETQKASEGRRSELLVIQGKVGDLESRVADIAAEIKDRRTSILNRLFVREEPAIWNARSSGTGEISAEIANAITVRGEAFREYAAANAGRFVLHAAVLMLIIGGFIWARKRIAPLVEKDEKVERAANIFRHPIAAGLVLSIFLSGWIYPQSPRLLTAVLGAAAMVPTVIILRRLVDGPIFLIVYVLVGFFFFDRVRDISAEVPLVSRILFLTEMAAAVLLLTYFLRSKRLASRVEAGQRRIFDTLRRIVPAAIAVFSAAFVANLIGAVNLSNIIGNGVLRSIYVALIIYTALEVVDALTVVALRVRPLSNLGMVKTNRTVIRIRVRRAARWLGVILWILAALTLFSVRDVVFSYLGVALSAELSVGSIKLSLGHLVAVAFAVWIAILVSRFIRFILEEDVYPRIDVGTGVSYAISTIVHYAILTVVLLLAVAALGFELSQFAIVAGAIGIGVGFGLQNIINNFVSGMILLFERPVKVGDTVQIGTQLGTLTQIGLRASVLRKVDGSDVIIPNSQLISEEVVNWTMSDDKRRLDIPIGVAYGTDPQRVLELLKGVADANDEILVEPAPKALFLAFGESSLDFELRAWTENTDDWVTIRSQLVTTVCAALTEAGIEIPFPQRDLNLRSVAASVAKDIRGE